MYDVGNIKKDPSTIQESLNILQDVWVWESVGVKEV